MKRVFFIFLSYPLPQSESFPAPILGLLALELGLLFLLIRQGHSPRRRRGPEESLVIPGGNLCFLRLTGLGQALPEFRREVHGIQEHAGDDGGEKAEVQAANHLWRR
jgi:hypothetical protein